MINMQQSRGSFAVESIELDDDEARPIERPRRGLFEWRREMKVTESEISIKDGTRDS